MEKIVLTKDIVLKKTQATVGEEGTIIIQQDTAGNHKVTLSNEDKGYIDVCLLPNSITQVMWKKDDVRTYWTSKKITPDSKGKKISTNFFKAKNVRKDLFVNTIGVLYPSTPLGSYSLYEDVWQGDFLICGYNGNESTIYSIAQYDVNGVFINGTYQGTIITGYITKHKDAVSYKLTIKNTLSPINQLNYSKTVLSYELYYTEIQNNIINKDEFGNEATYKPDVTDPQLNQTFVRRDEAVSVDSISFKYPRYIYCTCNDIKKDKNYSLSLYVDHFVDLTKKLSIKFKSNNSDKLPKFFGSLSEDETIYNDSKVKSESLVSDSLVGPDINQFDFITTKRSILQSATANTPIKALFIGDSLTNGTGANYPVNVTGIDNPTTFWSYMAKLSAIDKIDNNGVGFDFLSIGRNSQRTISINGTTKKVWAEGRGGWRVEDYCFNKNNQDGAPNNYENYFYDAAKVWNNPVLNNVVYGTKTGIKFSLKSYLEKYKTLADDGVTRLVVGQTAGSNVINSNDWDVCTPNVVVIQLCHNGTAQNFSVYIDYMILAIKEEFPNMPIVISLIDASGTYFPENYPKFDASSINMLGDTLHSKNYSLIEKHLSLHNENNKVYYCENFFIQPTAWGVASRSIQSVESIALNKQEFEFNIETGAGANYHPSTFAHAAWAYHLLSMIRWILN